MVFLASIVTLMGLGLVMYVFWRQLNPEQQTVLHAIYKSYFLFFLSIILILFVAIGSALDWIFRFYIIPVNQLAEQVNLINSVNPELRIRIEGCHDIKRLKESINEITEKQALFRSSVARQLRSASQETKAERNILAALLENLPQGILVCNMDGNIVFYNRKSKALLAPQQIEDGRRNRRTLDRHRTFGIRHHRSKTHSPGA